MVIRGFITLILCIWIQGTIAAGDFLASGGRSASMGYCCMAISDYWSVMNNQAGMAWSRQISFGAFFDNRYLVKEISYKTLGLTLPFKRGALGLSLSHYGYSLYNEIKTGLASSLRIGESFSVGIQVDYFRVSVGSEGSARHLMTFEVSGQFRPKGKVAIGVHLFNPIPVKISEYSEIHLPTVFQFGISCSFTKEFMVALDVEKDLDFKPIVKVGGEYKLVKSFCMRFGFLTNPYQFTFGVGVEWWNLRFDLASSYHPVLGYSPQGSLVYCLK